MHNGFENGQYQQFINMPGMSCSYWGPGIHLRLPESAWIYKEIGVNDWVWGAVGVSRAEVLGRGVVVEFAGRARSEPVLIA